MAGEEPTGNELERLRVHVAALDRARQEWQATEQTLRATVAQLESHLQQTAAESATASARLERHLRFTEALLAAVPTPVFFKDTAGRYLGCNRAFEEQLGVRAAELKGKTVFELWPSAHACVYHAKDIELVRHPARQSYEFRVRDAQGRDREVLFAKDVFRDETGAVAGIVGAYMDITDRRAAAEALRREKELFHNYLDIAHVLIVALDTAGQVTLVNRQTCAVLGRTADELVGHDWFATALPLRLQAPVRAVFDRLMAGDLDTVEHFENPVLAATGEERLVAWHNAMLRDAAGRPVGTLSSGMDITEQRRAEDDLRRQGARLSAIINHTPNVAIEIFDAQGRVRYWNPAATAIFGFSEAEVLGQTLDQFLLDPAAAAEFQAALQTIAATGRPRGPAEWQVRCRDGTTKYVLSTIFRIPSASGQPEFIGTAVDLTGQRRAQEERLALERQLLNAQKLESLGVLAGGIAHEFNNLLTAVLGNADLALAAVPAGSATHDYLRDIEAAARRAAGLCRQMLAYSGKGRLVGERLSLNDVVHELSQLLAVAAGKKATLRYQLAPALPATVADRAQLHHVLLSLTTNAAEAIGDQPGLITLTTGVVECAAASLAEPHQDPGPPPGPYVFLDVADTGSGMTPEVRARIFDPFFSTKFAGRGLGLPAVLGIVRGHRGAIKVTTAPAAGTCVRVLLPVAATAAAPTPAMTGGAPAAPPTPPAAATVLLVDDEDIVRTVAAHLLASLGYRPLVARDGHEALELFRTHRADIAAVLLDLTMPRLDGAETCRELRRLDPDVPIVVASGYSEPDMAARFAACRIASFLPKPYRLETLATHLRAALAGPRPPAPPA